MKCQIVNYGWPASQIQNLCSRCHGDMTNASSTRLSKLWSGEKTGKWDSDNLSCAGAPTVWLEQQVSTCSGGIHSHRLTHKTESSVCVPPNNRLNPKLEWCLKWGSWAPFSEQASPFVEQISFFPVSDWRASHCYLCTSSFRAAGWGRESPWHNWVSAKWDGWHHPSCAGRRYTRGDLDIIAMEPMTSSSSQFIYQSGDIMHSELIS